MRVLVTGVSSLPGYRIALSLAHSGHFDRVIGTYRNNRVSFDSSVFDVETMGMDVREYCSLERIFESVKPDVVIHAAAFGDVDGCERDRGMAWDTNVVGSLNVSRLASKSSSFVVYLSTDYIFDGMRGMYSEVDDPDPVNYYGLTKLGGELVFMGSSNDVAIVRASSIYGLGPGRKNFAKFLVERLSAGEHVRALSDQFTSPTNAVLLAESVNEIVERRLSGVFHVVGERMSRYDFAIEVARTLGFDRDLIEPVGMDGFRWHAPRPRDSSLSYELTMQKLTTDFHSTDRAMEILSSEFREMS